MTSKVEVFAQRKVLGVKTLYLVGVLVALLAVYAFYMSRKKKTAAGNAAGSVAADVATYTSTNPGIEGVNQAVAAVGTDTLASTTVAPIDNDAWSQLVVKYFQDSKTLDAISAQMLVAKYLSGASLTYNEGNLMNAAIGVVGQPPMTIVPGGVQAPVTVVTPTPSPAPTPTPVPAPTPAPTPSLAPYPYGSQRFLNGSRGAVVGQIQSRLNTVNGAGLAVDNVFGIKTTAAVRAYQSRTGIPVDGVVGPVTWGYLFA